LLVHVFVVDHLNSLPLNDPNKIQMKSAIRYHNRNINSIRRRRNKRTYSFKIIPDNDDTIVFSSWRSQDVFSGLDRIIFKNKKIWKDRDKWEEYVKRTGFFDKDYAKDVLKVQKRGVEHENFHQDLKHKLSCKYIPNEEVKEKEK